MMGVHVVSAPFVPKAPMVRVAALVAAALPDIGSISRATELTRNVSCVLLNDPDPVDVEKTCRDAIEHRMTHFGLTVIDVDRCVAAMVTAWNASGQWFSER